MIAALALQPEKGLTDMTDTELYAERDRWHARVVTATGFGSALVFAACEVNRIDAELRRRHPPARPIEKRLAETIVHLEAAVAALTPDEPTGSPPATSEASELKGGADDSGKAAELLVDIGYVLARTHDLFRETDHG